jgi:hypothetical protein
MYTITIEMPHGLEEIELDDSTLFQLRLIADYHNISIEQAAVDMVCLALDHL